MNVINNNQTGSTGNPPPSDNQGTSGKKFRIPFSAEQKYPDLIQLILGTESMNDDERQYWFQILPIMNEEQIARLKQILINEKQQLAELDAKYANELQSINEKHGSEWDAYKAQKTRQELKQTESVHEQSEKASEEDVLKKLEEI